MDAINYSHQRGHAQEVPRWLAGWLIGFGVVLPSSQLNSEAVQEVFECFLAPT